MSQHEEMVKRIGGYLHRVVPIKDATGKVLDYALKPLMIEFKPRDVMQVVVGASLLSIPVAFTEETWVLGAELPMANVVGLSVLSLLFIGLFGIFITSLALAILITISPTTPSSSFTTILFLIYMFLYQIGPQA